MPTYKQLLARYANEVERNKKWTAKKKAQGFTMLQVLISKAAKDLLIKHKDMTGKSFPTLVEDAILNFYQRDIVSIEPPKGRAIPKAELLDTISDLHDQGLSHAKIADGLMEKGILTPRGKDTWHKGSIANLLKEAKGR